MFDVAKSVQNSFVAILDRIMETFNAASTPDELGFQSAEFPFMIWREHASHHTTKFGKSARTLRPPSIGEILQVGEGGGAKARYGYFLGFAQERMMIQLSGEKAPTKIAVDRAHSCRGAAVFVPGPLKQEERAQEKVSA